jgi:hypothetical protein
MHYPMAAMSDKKYEEKYSWEDIKFTIGFDDKNGSPIDAETKKFKFIYKDEAGCCCEVSYDGKTRKNCVFRDGVLYGIFNSGTFRYHGGVAAGELYVWMGNL